MELTRLRIITPLLRDATESCDCVPLALGRTSDGKD